MEKNIYDLNKQLNEIKNKQNKEKLNQKIDFSIITHTNLESAMKIVGFPPMLLVSNTKPPYKINDIRIIDNKIIEVSYSELHDEISRLSIITYKYPMDVEIINNLSLLHGLDVKIDLSHNTPFYILKVNDTSNLAFWSVEQYTFMVIAKNTLFSRFNSFVIDNIINRCNHYKNL